MSLKNPCEKQILKCIRQFLNIPIFLSKDTEKSGSNLTSVICLIIKKCVNKMLAYNIPNFLSQDTEKSGTNLTSVICLITKINVQTKWWCTISMYNVSFWTFFSWNLNMHVEGYSLHGWIYGKFSLSWTSGGCWTR